MVKAHDISLTEEQRITLLEETVRRNQFMLIGALAALALFVIITLFLLAMRLMNPPSEFAAASSYQKVTDQIEQIEKKNKNWYERVDSLRLELDHSQASVFKAIFFEQEESYQLHLKALKQGMHDLAHMVPGSRTWLEIYNEKMDAALARSQARMDKLSQVQTSDQPNIEAVPVPTQPAPVNISN